VVLAVIVVWYEVGVVADYIENVNNWLEGEGYTHLPTEMIGPGKVIPGICSYRLDGNSLVLIKLIDSSQAMGSFLLDNLEAEFRNLEEMRGRGGFQFAYLVVVHVFAQPTSAELIEEFRRAKKVSAISRCYLLPWVVDLSSGEAFLHKGLPKNNFGLLAGDSPLKRPNLGTSVVIRTKMGNPNRSQGEEEVTFRPGRPWATYLIIAACILLAVITGGTPDLVVLMRLGAKVNSLIVAGEYWRFVTPVFLHAGFLHLAFNMLFLYSIGPGLESLFGHRRFLGVFLCAGVLGNVASFAFTPGISVGASGALFGLVGGFLYFWLRKPRAGRQIGKQMLSLILFNIIYGFINPSVDNWAHLGGLTGGFLASASLGLPGEKSGPQIKVPAAAALLALAWLGVRYGFSLQLK